jgi:hypothetical protein
MANEPDKLILIPNKYGCAEDISAFVCEHVTEEEAQEGRRMRLCDLCFMKVSRVRGALPDAVVLSINPNNNGMSCAHIAAVAHVASFCMECAAAIIINDAEVVFETVPDVGSMQVN